MTDAATIARAAKKLTPAQKAALLHANAGGCAYQWASIGTLTALNARGLVSYRPGGLGDMFSPQTNIRWPVTPLGLAVRKYLKSEQQS